ncbi:lipid-transfer protein [Parasphingopyxis algicola]|uniref:lipid-transfer protein n=1 Tax=Parasphingopyxis algicola TaxID=2026624 RepID=UPI0015A10E89|nr:lipid-transfer protein [Parasphingopyxis algicola]QLC26461.1 lipid-transfer protein [Parasphingopyxis algicola]
MPRTAIVAGVAMTPFATPRRSRDYRSLARDAVGDALADGGLDYDRIEQAYAGYVYGDSTSGQAALYASGLTGIPIVNVNNNCATGSTALFLARQAVAGGTAECVLALGFEQMGQGALASVYDDRPDPLDPFLDTVEKRLGPSDSPMALRLFGGAGLDYQRRYGAEDRTFALIAEKARRHAAKNPFAVFRDPLSVEDILASPPMYGPLTRLQCCPPTCGAAAAVLCSKEFAKKHGIADDVAIAGQAMTTDRPDSFDGDDLAITVGAGMSRAAARNVYAEAGIGPTDIDLVELHDCFTANELLSYESLGLTEKGTAERFIRDGDNSYGGTVVTNPSGGLLSKGHPLGATGLAQCFELVTQLRGAAGERQVDGARLALQHNIGLGGACVVTLYENRAGRA